MMNGKPCPPLRYSAIALELEREFPQMDPHEIHALAGERLAVLNQARKGLENGNFSIIANDKTVLRPCPHLLQRIPLR
jgi:sensor histidine kinase regulating citrate/malate metabolism